MNNALKHRQAIIHATRRGLPTHGSSGASLEVIAETASVSEPMPRGDEHFHGLQAGLSAVEKARIIDAAVVPERTRL